MNSLPILSSSLDAIIPHSYVIHHSTQICVCCGSKHEFSTLYAKTHFKARMGFKYVSNLRAVPWPAKLYNLPIETLHLKPVQIPFCHSCNRPSLGHCDAPPPPLALVAGTQIGTAAKPKEAPKSSTSKPKPTLDDLLI